MNKLCRKYLSVIKSFFPMIGKKERQYLSSLKTEIQDCYLENDIQTLEDFYHVYGYPSDIVNWYYTQVPPEELIRKIRTGRRMKKIILAVLVLFISSSVICGVHMYHTYLLFKEGQIYSAETVIE